MRSLQFTRDDHILLMCNKVSKHIGILRRIKKKIPVTLLRAYVTCLLIHILNTAISSGQLRHPLFWINCFAFKSKQASKRTPLKRHEETEK